MRGIEVKDLSKHYGKTTALKGASVCFEEHKIYGLLGRNGAGKTTLLNLITGRIFADGGSITVDGRPSIEQDALLDQIHMMSEQTLYPEGMKVARAFEAAQMFYPTFSASYAKSLAERFKLDTRKKVKSLSTGYTSIFKLIIALATGAPYILLDEPVLGLDANHRELFYQIMLEQYAQKPFTVVLSTHLVEEISPIVEHVVIIHQGAILYDGSRDALLEQGYTVSGAASAVDAFAQGRRVIGSQSLGGLKTVSILGDRPDAAPQGLELAPMDLQKLFVRMTGEEA